MDFHRLHNQQITSPRFNNAEDIVRWMGAIQAQDYAGALWGIGLRLKNKTESDIEKAIAEKKDCTLLAYAWDTSFRCSRKFEMDAEVSNASCDKTECRYLQAVGTR